MSAFERPSKLSDDRPLNETLAAEVNRILTVLESTQRFDSGWGVRLRLATMEGAAETAAYQFLDRSLSPQRFMPTVGGWSIQYQVIASVVDYILHCEIEDPLIVELGSGVSTSWIGLALKKLGRGRLISVEHDPRFAKTTQYAVDKLDLNGYVNISLSELKNISGSHKTSTWYDVDSIVGHLDSKEKIDLLLVDGPPGNAGPNSRYPAFPFMKQYLAESSLIVLDDTDRKQEQDIVSEWVNECSSRNSKNKLEVIEVVGRSTWMRYSFI